MQAHFKRKRDGDGGGVGDGTAGRVREGDRKGGSSGGGSGGGGGAWGDGGAGKGDLRMTLTFLIKIAMHQRNKVQSARLWLRMRSREQSVTYVDDCRALRHSAAASLTRDCLCDGDRHAVYASAEGAVRN